MKTVAVILAGCGYLDGAEIREAVLTLLALENEQVSYRMFAPDKTQHHVVNHLAGEPVADEQRNILQESARIARGDISDMMQLNVDDFDALVMPGGFGVAKNLSTFAFDGSQATIDEHLLKVVKQFYQANKPIGAICIAPAIVALALGENKPTLTIGNDQATADELEKLGAVHQPCETVDCVLDSAHKIITSPAYMDDKAKLADVFAGISKLVHELVKLA